MHSLLGRPGGPHFTDAETGAKGLKSPKNLALICCPIEVPALHVLVQHGEPLGSSYPSVHASVWDGVFPAPLVWAKFRFPWILRSPCCLLSPTANLCLSFLDLSEIVASGL